MSDIIEITQETAITPDPDGVYVWRGGTGPRFGNLASFRSRRRRTAYRPSDDWTRTIQAACDFADRHHASHVYVVRS